MTAWMECKRKAKRASIATLDLASKQHKNRSAKIILKENKFLKGKTNGKRGNIQEGLRSYPRVSMTAWMECRRKAKRANIATLDLANKQHKNRSAKQIEENKCLKRKNKRKETPHRLKL